MVTGRAPSRAQPVAATCYTYLRTRRGTRSIASDAEARLPARERLVLGIELRVLVHRLRRTGLVACLVQNPEPAMSKRSSDSKVGPELPGVLEGAKSSSSWGYMGNVSKSSGGHGALEERTADMMIVGS